MDWQQIASLVIVATTVFLVARSAIRKRRLEALGVCQEDCGCSVNELVKKIPEDRLRQLREEQTKSMRP